MTVTDEQFSTTVQDWLDRIEERLITAAVSESPFVSEAAGHVIAAGGKRFRPALVVTAAHCIDEPFDEIRVIGEAANLRSPEAN
ncbi:MAG: hypothetical protein B7Z22_09050, partial [Hyphomonas sp. 32-62-5]